MSESKSTSKQNIPHEAQVPPNPNLMGISEAEADSKTAHIDLAAIQKKERRRFIRHAIRKNIFTLFNFDLIGITIILYVLGSTLGALGSLVVLIIAVALNTFQEAYTKKELVKILENIQPQATVIRDGHIRSIDRWRVVEGDLLVVRQGDQIMVNGILIGASSLTVEEAPAPGLSPAPPVFGTWFY